MSETTKNENGATPCFFSEPDECRQSCLEVEDTVFWISKESLCAYSSVFKKMLYGEFAEAEKHVVRLPDKKADHVRELLLCLFPTPLTKKIDYTNVDLLLTLADEYQMADLTHRCCDFFDIELGKLPDKDSRLLEILILTSKHRLHRVLPRTVERCALCFTPKDIQHISDRLPLQVLGAIGWMKFVMKDSGKGCSNTKCTKCGRTTQCLVCEGSPDKHPWSCGIVHDLLERI